MADLYVGLAVIVLLTVGSFAAAWGFAHKVDRRVSSLAAFAIVIWTIAFIFYVRDNVLLTKLLPFSNLVVLGNWFLPSAGLLCGLAWHRTSGKLIRTLPLMLLCSVAAYATVEPLLGSPPDCSNSWTEAGDICLQTSDKTCTPACAATILQACGIRTTEQEMAELCLTREGTTWQGLYRGLQLKTHNTPWTVEVFECNTDELRTMRDKPVILSMELKKDNELDRSYMEQAGFIPGTPHAVVFYGLYEGDPDQFIICDPTGGREIWPPEALEILWHGRGMRLVPR